MNVDGPWRVEPRTVAVFDALERAGGRAFFVGGAVRNAALGVPVGDIDLATDLLPDRVMAVGKEAGFHAVPTGIAHGTVTLVSGGLPHEVTTFRKDVATDGRRAVVAFTDRIEEDAMRRDFTINALYADRQGAVRDPSGGLPDIAARRVRFVGDAAKRIAEDYLRILRFFRFHAEVSGPDAGFDEEALAAIAGGAEGLRGLSAERIGQEMKRLLAAKDPGPAVATMAAVGVLPRILPGADPAALARLAALDAERAADPMRRLAALRGENPAETFRLSNAEARRLDDLRAAIGGAEIAEIAWREGQDFAWDAALLRAASAASPVPPDTAQRIDTGATAKFPIRAQDLMPAYHGAALGDRLAQLERAWIASDFTARRDELLSLPKD
ncbi:MAG: CCA tRNA nucleotidyltransferase [Pseudomonadota bacterium]